MSGVERQRDEIRGLPGRDGARLVARGAIGLAEAGAVAGLVFWKAEMIWP